MKHIAYQIIFFVLSITYINAQSSGANISFEKESHFFGKILEAKGPVSYVFTFNNTGSEPLLIQSVQASCGCTTPEWSRQPVAPGGKGFIKATFNPAGRPGPFEKSITVVSNSLRNMVILKFSGEVVGKEPTLNEQFPFAMGDLRFSTSYISFGKLSPGKNSTQSLEVINTGTQPINISFPSAPSHVEILVKPSTIKPKQKATIEFTYDAVRKNDWGFVTDAINFTINGKSDGMYRINLSGTIGDDYSGATPDQLAAAPRMALEKNSFDIGKIKAGTTVEIVYKFKNVGKSTLQIHKINPTCGCTNIKTTLKTINAGASGEITAVFNSAGQKGSINKGITVVTNDPNNLNLMLWVRGTVE